MICVECAEKKGIELFVNKEVILWILESDLNKSKSKIGKLVSVDHTHVVIEFTSGYLTGENKAYLRNTITRIDLYKRGESS